MSGRSALILQIASIDKFMIISVVYAPYLMQGLCSLSKKWEFSQWAIQKNNHTEVDVTFSLLK